MDELIAAVQVADTKAPGGIEAAVEHYAAMFDAVGAASLCVYRGPDRARLEANGVRTLEPDSSLFAPWTGLLPHVALRRAALERLGGEPELAIVHSDRALEGVRRAFPRARIVAPCHSDKFKRKRRADLVVTLNDEQQAKVSAGLAGSGAQVARLGNPYVPKPRRKRRSGPKQGRVVFCARFTPTKDPMTVLRAFLASKAAQQRTLTFIGSGPLEAEVREEAARAAGSARIEFLGWRPDPWAEVGPDDLLVLPSHWEGLPYLLQEALDRGVPIAAADNAGNRAALGEGRFGRLFPVGDAAALAREIDAAFADPEDMRARTAAGRARLAAEYGAEGFWRRLREAAGIGSSEDV